MPSNVVIVLLGSFAAGVVGVEVGLDAQPCLSVDEKFVGAVVVDAAEVDDPVVVGVGEDLVHPGGGDWFGGLREGVGRVVRPRAVSSLARRDRDQSLVAYAVKAKRTRVETYWVSFLHGDEA